MKVFKKIIVLGDKGVGKTPFIHNYTRDGKSPIKFKPTVGLDLLTKEFMVSNNNYCLKIWDTPGSDQYQFFLDMGSYLDNADLAVIVYSIFDKQSYENVMAKWYPKINHINPKSSIILVGLSIPTDKSVERKVSKASGLELAHKNGMQFMESSLDEIEKIKEIFETVITLNEKRVQEPEEVSLALSKAEAIVTAYFDISKASEEDLNSKLSVGAGLLDETEIFKEISQPQYSLYNQKVAILNHLWTKQLEIYSLYEKYPRARKGLIGSYMLQLDEHAINSEWKEWLDCAILLAKYQFLLGDRADEQMNISIQRLTHYKKIINKQVEGGEVLSLLKLRSILQDNLTNALQESEEATIYSYASCLTELVFAKNQTAFEEMCFGHLISAIFYFKKMQTLPFAEEIIPQLKKEIEELLKGINKSFYLHTCFDNANYSHKKFLKVITHWQESFYISDPEKKMAILSKAIYVLYKANLSAEMPFLKEIYHHLLNDIRTLYNQNYKDIDMNLYPGIKSLIDTHFTVKDDKYFPESIRRILNKSFSNSLIPKGTSIGWFKMPKNEIDIPPNSDSPFELSVKR